MHMKGEPKTMQKNPRYADVVREVRGFLEERAEHAIRTGVVPENIVLDPGIGFGKTLEHNLALLKDLGEIVSLGFPVLVGASRKAFLGAITGREHADDRAFGTVATTVLARERGAAFFRVHDVRANADALAVAEAVAASGV
jgi:dihydropteroate synthase